MAGEVSFYVIVDGSVRGPFTRERIDQLAGSGKLSPSSKVSIDRKVWIDLGSVDDVVASANSLFPIRMLLISSAFVAVAVASVAITYVTMRPGVSAPKGEQAHVEEVELVGPVDTEQRDELAEEAIQKFDREVEIASFKAEAQKRAIQNELANRLDADKTNATIFDDDEVEKRVPAEEVAKIQQEATEPFESMTGRSKFIEDTIRRKEAAQAAQEWAEVERIEALEKKFFYLNESEKQLAVDSIDAVMRGDASAEQFHLAREWERFSGELQDALAKMQSARVKQHEDEQMEQALSRLTALEKRRALESIKSVKKGRATKKQVQVATQFAQFDSELREALESLKQ